MKMKRLLSLLLALLVIGSTLAGCGKKEEKSAENTPAQQTTAPAKLEYNGNDVSKPVELTMYLPVDAPQDEAVMEAELNKYLKDKINATVKITRLGWGDNYQNKLIAMSGSRQEFDICFTASWLFTFKEQAGKGAFLKLNDLLPKYAPNAQKALGDDFLNAASINGDIYALPTLKEKAHAWGFIFNKALVDKYNIDITKIKSLEDLEPALKLIKEKEPTVYPLEALVGENPAKLLDFDNIAGDKTPGVLYNNSKDYKPFFQFDTPEYQKYFETIRKYFLAGYIRKDAPSVTDFEADEKAGKIFCAVKSLKPGKDVELTAQQGIQWVQQYVTSPVISNREANGAMLAVSTTSKNPERALMFIDMLYSDPVVVNYILYGVKDKHYVEKGKNEYGYMTIDKGPDQSRYNPGNGWLFGNQFLNYLTAEEDPKKWQLFEEFNKSASTTQTLGFTFDTAPVKNEIATMTNIWDKYVPSLETGAADYKVLLPKFKDEMNKAGMQKVLDEMTKQLQDWAKKNGKM